MARSKRSLPVNVTDRTLAYWSTGDGTGWHSEPLDSPKVVNARLEEALPARDFAAHPRQRHYEGSWWSSKTRAHVAFESLLERDALLWFDWDPQIVSVSAQPLAFLWPYGTPGHKSHVPDYFVRLADGDGRLVDVRAEDRRTEKALGQFDMTRQACETIGWQYDVWAGLPEPLALSLRWLAGYRQDRSAPTPVVRERLLTAFTTAQPLAEGVDQVATFARQPAETVTANAYHLLWRHELRADLTRPLSWDTEVRTA